MSDDNEKKALRKDKENVTLFAKPLKVINVGLPVFHDVRIEGRVKDMSTVTAKCQFDFASGGIDGFFTGLVKKVAVDGDVGSLYED